MDVVGSVAVRDLLAINIDELHVRDELTLVAAVGIDNEGNEHTLAVVEGATESTATVQALLDNLTGRGLDPVVCRLFIIDGARAPSKAIQQTFGRHTHADPTVSDLQGPATSSSACRAIWSARRCVEDNAARAGQLMKSPCAPPGTRPLSELQYRAGNPEGSAVPQRGAYGRVECCSRRALI
jgi:hypothetical protein